MIPVNSLHLTEQDLANANEALATGWISSSGRFIEEFESSWASYCGREHGIAVANGTVALQLAIAALKLDPGAEVILPSFTIVSCAMAVLYNDCVPVFVDCDPDTWCMDVDMARRAVTERTAAIMPVHMYGHPVDMDPLLELASDRGLAVVEDAAQAHGAEYLSGGPDAGSWRRSGSFGDVSCFSFYANKPVTTGEGGMVVTDDGALADRARSLRNLAFGRGRRFLHEELGFNFRLTNLQAALGVAQIERMDEIVARKREIGHAYRARLAELPGIRTSTERDWARSIFWMFGVVVDEATGLDASRLADALYERGIETRPFFLGLHEQPALEGLAPAGNGSLAQTERLARQGLYLPTGLGLTDEELVTVCATVEEVLA